MIGPHPDTFFFVFVEDTAILLIEFIMQPVQAPCCRFVTIQSRSGSHKNLAFRSLQHTTDLLSFPVSANHFLITQYYLVHAGMIIAHSLIVKPHPDGIILMIAINALNCISHSIARQQRYIQCLSYGEIMHINYIKSINNGSYPCISTFIHIH